MPSRATTADPALTRQQRRVLNFVGRFLQTEGYAPSLDEIRSHLGLSAVSTVHEHIAHLASKGYLTRGWNRSRSLSLTGKGAPGATRRVRVTGSVARGGWVRRRREGPTVEVPSHMGGAAAFALRVRDDGFRAQGILASDLLIVDPAAPVAGDVVLVGVKGRGVVVRRFEPMDDNVRLLPVTGRGRALRVKKSEAGIEGVVVGLMRDYKSGVD